MAPSAVLLLWGPVVLLMALIFTVSSMPDPGSLPGGVSDKTGHVAAYAVLGALVLRALARGWRGDVTVARCAAAAGFAALYGVTDELHQMLVPGRTAELMDVAADAVGAVCGVALVVALRAVLARLGWLERYTRSADS